MKLLKSKIISSDENVNIEHDLLFTLANLNNTNFYSRQLINVYIPVNNLYTKIDLILINTKGIYVFEYKSFNGIISGKQKSKYWNQLIKNDKRKFLNPIDENDSHIKTLKNIFNIENDNKNLFKSYILFNDSNKTNLEKIRYKESSILKVINKDNLIDILSIDNRTTKSLLSKEQVDYIFKNLQKYTIIDKNKNYVDEFFYHNK